MVSSRKQAYFRFYGPLNDFLPSLARQSEVRYSFRGRPSVKDAIEAQGVPHPEVDLLLVDGEVASFAYTLTAGDHVSVYPWIQNLNRPDGSLRPEWPSPLRFVCDVHLGTLARRLCMLGMDTRYDPEAGDEHLARISDDERRILLSRDLELLKRRRVSLGAFIREQEPTAQLKEVVERFGIEDDDLEPFTRCLDCNTPLRPAPSEAVENRVPPHARRVNDHFKQCPSCESVYWEGTHVDRMRRLMRQVFGDENK